MQNKYFESREEEKQRIFKALNDKYENLNIELRDFDVIAGRPYVDANKEPPKDDLNSQLY